MPKKNFKLKMLHFVNRYLKLMVGTKVLLIEYNTEYAEFKF